MRYLIIVKDKLSDKVNNAFYSNHFDYENDYPEYPSSAVMTIVDLKAGYISFNGKDWEPIEEDHL